MIDLPENELFSAYLDGELTAEEQVQVEQLLATSAAARQLMDELRALSATLQALPVHKPQVDLSQRVLRAAERQILSGGDVRQPPGGDVRQPAGGDVRPAETVPPESAPSPASLVGREVLKRFLQPRSLLWAAAIFLVALILRLQEGRQANPPAAPTRNGQQIAMAPPSGRGEEAPSIHAPEKRASTGELKRAEIAASPVNKSDATAGLPDRDSRTAGQASSGTLAEQASSGTQAERNGGGAGGAGMPVASPPADAVASTAPPSKASARDSLSIQHFPTAAKASHGASSPPAGPAANAVASMAGKSPSDGAFGGGQPTAPGGQPTAPGGQPMAAAAAPAELPAAQALDAAAPARSLKSEAEEKVLLVECEVTFQADRQHVFEKILADQQLSGRLADYRWRDGMARRNAEEDEQAAGKPAIGGPRPSRRGAAKKAADKDAQVDAPAPSEPAAAAERPVEVAPTRTFEVQATPQQLDAILRRLKARPGDFPSVSSTSEVDQLDVGTDQVASFGANRKQASAGRSAAADARDRASSPPYQGVAAGAAPVPATPPAVMEKKAAAENRPMEKGQREALAETRKGLTLRKGGHAEDQKRPEAWGASRASDADSALKPSSASLSKAAPQAAQSPGLAPSSPSGGLTYHVHFRLRVVSPEPSVPAAPAAAQPSPAAEH